MNRQAPRLLGLFQKRIDGDDTLLRLAQARFRDVGLGAEFYAENPDELQWLLDFRPSPELPAAAHLGRGINLFKYESRSLIREFARRFAHDVYGLVIHDQWEVSTDPDRYVSALEGLERILTEGPFLFVEYAVGLEPDFFLELFRRIRGLDHISACIDIGHVGIRQAAKRFREMTGSDISSLSPSDPRLRDLAADLEKAVSSALPVVLKLIRGLGEIGKPLHFHLHDGHPLYKGDYGVSDHRGFSSEIIVENMSLSPMYGPSGLKEIISAARSALDPALLSFSLEIHPPQGQTPLEGYEYFFHHWADKTNAERMNHWLSLLLRNHQLLLEVCRD